MTKMKTNSKSVEMRNLAQSLQVSQTERDDNVLAHFDNLEQKNLTLIIK